MVSKIILAIVILTAVAVIALIINAVEDYNRKFDLEFSIKESLNLANLPIITFVNNGKNLNFLIDTGATFSVINESILPSIIYEAQNDQGNITGISGDTHPVKFCYIDLESADNNISVNDSFSICNMDSAFKPIKDECGIQIDGILGNTFLSAYSCLIDFRKAKIYSKK